MRRLIGLFQDLSNRGYKMIDLSKFEELNSADTDLSQILLLKEILKTLRQIRDKP